MNFYIVRKITKEERDRIRQAHFEEVLRRLREDIKFVVEI